MTARRPGRALLHALALGVAVASAACAHHGEPDIATLASNSDQVIWEAGQKAFEKHQWESARQHFRRIIDGFPQSEFAPAARLALGDSYFQEGGTANDILAIGAYREFLTLYPSHPKSDYSQFQIAEAYYRQRNGPDRDQTATHNALSEYERVAELYPNSSHVQRAQERIVECRQTLARAEFLAGYFYQHTRQYCRAAVSRYEGIVADYPDYKRLDEVLYRLGECLVETGRAAEALPHLSRLLSEYPQSEYAGSARELMSQSAHAPAPATPPAPTTSPAPGTPPATPGGETPKPSSDSAAKTSPDTSSPSPRPIPTPLP